MKPVTLGVAIPTYHNPERLRQCLLSIARHSPGLLDCTVIVDDSGSGSMAAALQTEFPSVSWIVHAQNQGFGRSATAAVMACPAEVVLLLNDDVQLLCDPAPIVTEAFRDDLLFAATFRSVSAQGDFREGAKRLVWPMGIPRILHNERDQHPPRQGRQPSAYAVGGHAAFRRSVFTELHGFDPLFDPFYWEDVDLSRRAIRRGWQVIYLTEVVVRHDEHGTIRSSFDRKRIECITLRNRLLFAWRHMPFRLWPLHVLALCFHMAPRDSLWRHAWRDARAQHHALTN